MTPPRPRRVRGNVIDSADLPRARITVDPALAYVGGPRFTLYGIAHAEQHLFVATDDGRAVRRLVWVQFEGFLPDNQRTYRYPETETVEIGDVPFLYDVSRADVDVEVADRPGSDLAAARDFLLARGCRLTGTVEEHRFVHLLGTDRRHELMVVYAERPVAGDPDDRAGARERALSSFDVRFR